MPFLPFHLRTATKCLLVQRRHPLMHVRHRDREHHWIRNFSTTHRQQAAEDPQSILAQLQSSPLIQRIADKPEALKALHEFANIIKDSGVQLASDKPPTMVQMFKLASIPEFREGAKRLVEELRKAGVDINSKNAYELFGIRQPPSQ